MILLNPIIQILTFANCDRLYRMLRVGLKAMGSVVCDDRLMIGLATVDNTVRSAVVFQCSSEEPFRCQQVAVFAEPEFHSVAGTIDGAVKVHPLPRTFM